MGTAPCAVGCGKLVGHATFALRHAADVLEEELGKTMDVATCSLDDSEAFPPVGQVWTSQKLEWVNLADGLPCFGEGLPWAELRAWLHPFDRASRPFAHDPVRGKKPAWKAPLVSTCAQRPSMTESPVSAQQGSLPPQLKPSINTRASRSCPLAEGWKQSQHEMSSSSNWPRQAASL